MKKPIHKGDFNQVAKYIVDLSTGQVEDKKQETKATITLLLPKEESKIIKKAARARMKRN
jgi:hypothetical protein